MTATPAGMTYADYLKLDQLLSAQQPLSDLHDAGSELLHLDERRNGVALARDEADCRKEREQEE